MARTEQDITPDPFPLGATVLVVDDSAHVAKAIRIVLAQNGIEVMGPASSLMEARSLLATGRPNAALVDVNLKGETAWSLIDELLGRGIPVVVMSGLPLKFSSKKPPPTFLQKPFNTKDLIEALAELRGVERS